MTVQSFTPDNLFKPIGPYSHISKAGQFINISGTPGVNPSTGELAGFDVYSQSKQILSNFQLLLESVGATLKNVMHINVFLKEAKDFSEMNRAYSEVVCVADLPKKDALLTMNLSAVLD